jgi:outer membrane lipoprotein SlyB
MEQASKPSGIGAVAGAVVGGVIGNQVGGGTGKTLATVAGAVGGGYAGNEIEKRTTKTLRHEVDVQMEDGTRQSFSYDAQPDWQAGDKVKVVGGALQRR